MFSVKKDDQEKANLIEVQIICSFSFKFLTMKELNRLFLRAIIATDLE